MTEPTNINFNHRRTRQVEDITDLAERTDQWRSDARPTYLEKEGVLTEFLRPRQLAKTENLKNTVEVIPVCNQIIAFGVHTFPMEKAPKS